MEGIDYTNDEIERMVALPKPVPPGGIPGPRASQVGKRYESKLTIHAHGLEFLVWTRQLVDYPRSFCAGLTVIREGEDNFQLRRYDGKYDSHVNHIEKEEFYDYHIHMATERYQQSPHNEDHYARPTAEYDSLGGAVRLMHEDCNIFEVQSGQLSLLWVPSQ